MKKCLAILLVYALVSTAAALPRLRAGSASQEQGKDEKKDQAKEQNKESDTPEKIDDKTIEKLTELSQKGERAYQDGKHQDSIDAFLGFLKLLPVHKQFNNPRAQAHYYIACNYSLIDKKKEAIDQLD